MFKKKKEKNEESKVIEEETCIEVYDQDLDYEEVCCHNCDNSGSEIQDIAKWEE